MNRPLNLKELCVFTRTFSAMMASSNSFTGTIETVFRKKTFGRVAKALSAVASDIRSGDTISRAFQKHEPLFGAFFCSMVMQGEKTGNPGSAFVKLSEYYEKREIFQKKITRLFKYPLFIISGTSGCLIILLLFLVHPGLHHIVTVPENLSIVGRATISAMIFVHTHAYYAAPLLASLIAGLFWLWHSNIKLPWLSALSWRIPVAGDVLRKNSLRRFAFSLSTLLSSGFDHGHALTIAAEELGNSTQEKRLMHALIDTMNVSGSAFSILRNISIFPSPITEMANQVKKHHRTDEYLKKIVSFYQDEVEAAVNAFAILTGPVFVMVSGLLGIGVIISLYLPVSKLVGNH